MARKYKHLEELSVSFIGTPQNHEAFMACLLSLIRQEEPLRPLFVRLGQMDVTWFPRGKDPEGIDAED